MTDSRNAPSNFPKHFSGAAPRRPTRSKARRWPTAPGRASGSASRTRRASCSDGDTGDVACDHYRRYADDVALMKRARPERLPLQHRRGAACCPTGRGTVNANGLGFYDRLVDALLAHGIEPLRDALPLGPARRARRPRRLAQSRHRRLVRRLRVDRLPQARRSRQDVGDAQRAVGGDRRRLPARRARARPSQPLRGADRVAQPAARARRGGAGLSRDRQAPDRHRREPRAQVSGVRARSRIAPRPRAPTPT